TTVTIGCSLKWLRRVLARRTSYPSIRETIFSHSHADRASRVDGPKIQLNRQARRAKEETMMSAKRRTIMRLLLAVAVGFLSIAISDKGAQAEEKLVLMTWGGTWLDYMKKDVIEPFEKETGIKIEVLTHQNTMDGLAKLKAQKANLDIDVWATSPVPALL